MTSRLDWRTTNNLSFALLVVLHILHAVPSRFCVATDPVEDSKDDLAHCWVAVPLRHFVIGKDLLKVDETGLEDAGL